MTTREPGSDRSRVLVSAASKHGATAEIGDRIGATLRVRGLDVTVAAPEKVSNVDEYGAVILGSAVYAGHWLEGARHLAELISGASTRPSVWLFSSGPIGDPPKPEEDPVDVADVYAQTSANGHQIFAGKIDKSLLSFGEKAIMIAVRAPEGDFRDWDEIDRWAGSVAESLGAGASG